MMDINRDLRWIRPAAGTVLAGVKAPGREDTPAWHVYRRQRDGVWELAAIVPTEKAFDDWHHHTIDPIQLGAGGPLAEWLEEASGTLAEAGAVYGAAADPDTLVVTA